MTPDILRRIALARGKLTAAKAAVVAANDELMALLHDPGFDALLLDQPSNIGGPIPRRSEEAVPVVQAGIRDASSGAFVTARTPKSAE